MTTEKLKCPMCAKELGSQSAMTMHIKKEHSDTGDLAKVMAKWGNMSPRPGGAWKPERPLQAAPSGVPSIDWAIGIGGLPHGCLVEIYGPAASGKTLTALTFSAYAQTHGGLAGYVDAERRLQPTFAKLVPRLDLDTLYYGQPKGGEAALNMSKDYISTGLYDVWTVDSVHGCVPQALMDKPIGEATMSELAKLMSVGCQVLDAVVAETNTVCIFVNHVKQVPGQTYGRDWFKPGGTALDYYASVQLHVRPTAVWMDSDKRKIGHTVRVRVENSKVAAPFAAAEYDIWYRDGQIKTTDKQPAWRNGQHVVPGIDLPSCWFGVCREAELIVPSGNNWVDAETGESYGGPRETVEMLADESAPVLQRARELVYPARYQRRDEEKAAA